MIQNNTALNNSSGKLSVEVGSSSQGKDASGTGSGSGYHQLIDEQKVNEKEVTKSN